MIGDGDCGEIGGMKIGRKNRSTRRKPALAPLCPPECMSGCADNHKDFFFSGGIHTLCKRWRGCIERNGDYVEKLYSCVPLLYNKIKV
jgi:hypothetical protein